ncbi:hypothetical protein MAHJHV34_38760 [Mycobacterium avium subsp. hominissuis]
MRGCRLVVWLVRPGGPPACGKHLPRPDHPEFRLRVGQRHLCGGQRQRRPRGIAAAGDATVAQGRQHAGQHRRVGDQGAVAFDGQVALGQLAVPQQPAHDVGAQAAGGDHRRLHR